MPRDRVGSSCGGDTTRPLRSGGDGKEQVIADRTQRRREDAVRRIVFDVTRLPTWSSSGASGGNDGIKDNTNDGDSGVPGATISLATGDTNSTGAISGSANFTNLPDDALLASAVAASIERGIDRELHNELVRQARKSATTTLMLSSAAWEELWRLEDPAENFEARWRR